MRNTLSLLVAAGLALGSFAEEHPYFIVVGDDAMRPLRYEGKRSEAGLGSWIDESDDYFRDWDPHILNYAAKDLTAESFAAGGRAHEFIKEIRKDNAVLIALEAKSADALRKLVKTAQAQGGAVMLANTLGAEDSGIARKLAAEEGLPFIDLRALAEAKGEIRDQPLADARKLAEKFVAEVRRQVLPLAKLYVEGRPGKVPRRRWDRRQRIEQRIAMMGPVGRGAFVVRPTYNSAGFRLGCEPGKGALDAFVRKVGEGEWTKAKYAPPYFEDAEEYRGSITGLAEGTEYELKVGEVTTKFRTWKTEVQVAKTIEIEPTAKFPIVISDRGAEDAWVRYTVKPGMVLKRDRTDGFLRFKGAAYVLVEGIHFDGGGSGEEGHPPVYIGDSEHVRIRNCEFTGWGRGGRADFARRGVPVHNGSRVDFDGAVEINRGAKCTTVEGCYFHDAYGKSNSWKYSHPAGNEAIMMCRPDHSTVLRWNDMVGSDLHRFNDAVEGEANFWENGGFNCDADVNGNFMIFCNDDNIELDGGQCNVRCFQNRFESSLCGVSIQGCMVSPVYVYDNDFVGLCEEFGGTGQHIKTWGFDIYGRSPVAYLHDNVFNGEGIRPIDKYVAPRGIVENNRDNPPKEAAKPRPEYPVRPLPFILDVARIDGVEVRKGVASRKKVAFKAKWTGGAGERPVGFEVRQNSDADWFRISPAKGSIGLGETVDFELEFLPERMNDRHFYRAAFLVRERSRGISRVCSVYAATDFAPPFKAEKPGEFALYVDAFKPDAGTPKIVDDRRGLGGKTILLESAKTTKGEAGRLEYSFEIPKAGRYYLNIHGASYGATDDLWAQGAAVKLSVSVDGAPAKVSENGTKAWMGWTVLAPGNRWGDSIRYFDFKPGRHTLSIGTKTTAWVPLYFDGLVVTDSPESFEIR